MANTSRSYAEQLVGPLNREHYDTQRKVANQSYETNWEDLQNQYKNLQEQLKQRQEQANRDYASGLVQVAENSFDRMNSANNNMVNRGLTTSGLNNLMTQADTTAKGEEVSKLLDNSGNIAVQIANQLKSGNENYADRATNLAEDLSDTLGNIGAKELSAEMEYNTGLANLAGVKDARDMENALAAKQRAANSISKSKEQEEIDEELEEYYKRKAINEILTDKDMNDAQKKNSLMIIFEKGNADDIIKAYNKNINATAEYEKKTKELNKKAKKESGVSNYYRKEAEGLAKSLKSEKTKRSWDIGTDEVGRDAYYVLYDYVQGNKENHTKKEVEKAYRTIMGAGPENKYVVDALEEVLYPKETKSSKELDKHTKSNISYEELANLLYGNR